MKITGAYVSDPREVSTFKDPFVVVKVDEDVCDQSDPVRMGATDYRFVPCGPFFAIEKNGADGWDSEVTPADIGLTNTLVQPVTQHNRTPGFMSSTVIQVMVEVREPGASLHNIHDLTMNVTRVRRLLRKYADHMTVVVDDEAALLGRVQFRVEHAEPMCYGGAMNGRHANSQTFKPEISCLATPRRTIVYRNTHLPLCTKHVRSLEFLMAGNRASA